MKTPPITVDMLAQSHRQFGWHDTGVSGAWVGQDASAPEHLMMRRAASCTDPEDLQYLAVEVAAQRAARDVGATLLSGPPRWQWPPTFTIAQLVANANALLELWALTRSPRANPPAPAPDFRKLVEEWASARRAWDVAKHDLDEREVAELRLDNAEHALLKASPG